MNGVGGWVIEKEEEEEEEEEKEWGESRWLGGEWLVDRETSSSDLYRHMRRGVCQCKGLE